MQKQIFFVIGALLMFGAVGLSMWENRRLKRDLDRLERRMEHAGEREEAEPAGVDPELRQWRREVEKMIEETYGDVLQMSLKDEQLDRMVRELREGGRREDPEAEKALLKGMIDRELSRALEEQGLVLKKKLPTVDDMISELALTDAQAALVRQIVQEAQNKTIDLLQQPRDDGIHLLSEFARLDNLPAYSPEREGLGWKLLKLRANDGRTLHEHFLATEEGVDRKFQNILTPDQYRRYKQSDVIPTQVLGTFMEPGR